MEVVHSTHETFPGSPSRKSRLPLGQLVEETRRSADVPNHLLETRIFAKLKCNSLIQAEPQELHFAGFELGKDYEKVLKLINVSSEVINVHILPTQTKYFQSRYSKKSRLVPGLSYTITVHFCPDEWRYFYDCVRIHCKGEENLLVPVHAYPIVNDLHIPAHISLQAVPLGQSLSRVIPLSCSCPVDFEFQVHCLQPHRAFSVRPLSGIIPANGVTEMTVTFAPVQYGTAETTLQVIISQFNSKPYVCTLTGTSQPNLTLSLQEESRVEESRGLIRGKAASTSKASGTKPKWRALQPCGKSRERRRTDRATQSTEVDVSTPAGLAKMLIQQQDKMSCKDILEAMSQTKIVHQTRQMREALFESQLRKDMQEERANHLRWQIHLGHDLCSTQKKMQILAEQEQAVVEYNMKKGEIFCDETFARVQPKLSSHHVLRNMGQIPDHIPVFSSFPSSQLEIQQRALRLFQQAVRKVILRCRMNKRLVSLKELVRSMRNLAKGGTVSEVNVGPNPLRLSEDKLLPATLPVFAPPEEQDELAADALGYVPVQPIRAMMTPAIPLFSLKVPQHYKLMGYQTVNPFEAALRFIPPELARPLQTGAQDELLPPVLSDGMASSEEEEEEAGEEMDDAQHDVGPGPNFTAPPGLLTPPQAHPNRIFNPAPGIYAFKPALSYLECDPEFHLCPLPKYTIPKGEALGVCASSTQKRFLERKDVIRGTATWKKLPSAALSTLSNTSTLTSDWAPRMSDSFNTNLLPPRAPPALTGLPEFLSQDIQDGPPDGTGVSLTPDMIGAEFSLLGGSPQRPLGEGGMTDDCLSKTPQLLPISASPITREAREQQMEAAVTSEANKLGLKVLARINHLKSLSKINPSLPGCK